MFVKNLNLENYRNIESAKLEFCDGMNVFYGDNAQGKTNAVEALFLCSTTKSFRKAKDENLINFNAERAKIENLFFDTNEYKLDIIFDKNKNREVFLDGMPCERTGDYLGKFLAVIFTPDHLSYVKSAPEERRKFLDLAICQASPVMLGAYREYARIIKQKNALLKAACSGGYADKKLIETYNEQIAKYCNIISQKRLSLCEKLTSYAGKFYSEMTSEKEKLEFEYVSNVSRYFKNYKDNEVAYIEMLRMSMEDEIEAGSCIFGVHRDDIKIKINGKNAREFASQGQQRSAVLAMKLAEGDYLKENRGSMPVFLLDDVLSELDESRCAYILEKIKSRQVIITSCTELSLINSDAVRYNVKNGKFNQI